MKSFSQTVFLLEDHARGLSTFTIMAGLGGSFGYALGAIDWDKTSIGKTFFLNIFSYFTKFFIRSGSWWTRKGSIYSNNFLIHMLRFTNHYKFQRTSVSCSLCRIQ